MNTSFTKVYEVFLQNIDDYRYNNLANLDYALLEKILKGILVTSIALYKNIEYDIDIEEFNSELTDGEINILGNCMLETWFVQHTNDMTVLSETMRGRDIKGESTANILKRNSDHLSTIRENRSQLINEESIRRIREQI